MKVTFYLTGLLADGLDREEVFEYEDGTPESKISDDWETWMFDIIDSGYEIED